MGVILSTIWKMAEFHPPGKWLLCSRRNSRLPHQNRNQFARRVTAWIWVDAMQKIISSNVIVATPGGMVCDARDVSQIITLALFLSQLTN